MFNEHFHNHLFTAIYMSVVWMLKAMLIAKGVIVHDDPADEEGDGDNIDEL